jgi:hypothetical protein
MATQDEQNLVREFLAQAFGDSLQPVNPSLVTNFIADLLYGNNQDVKAAKDKYKDFLDTKIAKIDLDIANLENEKAQTQARLKQEKIKRQNDKEKVK